MERIDICAVTMTILRISRATHVQNVAKIRMPLSTRMEKYVPCIYAPHIVIATICKSIGDGNLKYNPNTGLCAPDEE